MYEHARETLGVIRATSLSRTAWVGSIILQHDALLAPVHTSCYMCIYNVNVVFLILSVKMYRNPFLCSSVEIRWWFEMLFCLVFSRRSQSPINCIRASILGPIKRKGTVAKSRNAVDETPLVSTKALYISFRQPFLDVNLFCRGDGHREPT